MTYTFLFSALLGWRSLKLQLNFPSAQLLASFQQNYIYMVAKKVSPTKLSDFRPISLSNVSYKFFSKILNTRHKKTLSNIISKEQNSCLEGRSTRENIGLAQEMMQSISNATYGGNIILKLDVEKAFDRIEWFGFSVSFISLIHNCISLNTFAVLFQGAVRNYFSSSRGLRQGDPLLLYLFILAVQVLSRGIKREFTETRIDYFYTQGHAHP